METKASVRKKMLAARNSLAPAQREEYSNEICSRLIRRIDEEKPAQIFVYAAIGSEVSLYPLVRYAWQKGIPIAFPAVKGKIMDFYRAGCQADLKVSGRYHIPEPAPVPDKEMIPCKGAMILVPGSAFSLEGDRIGYGAGFYDEYFCRYPDIRKIGIAYDFQTEDFWQPDPFDRKMNEIITEKKEIKL